MLSLDSSLHQTLHTYSFPRGQSSKGWRSVRAGTPHSEAVSPSLSRPSRRSATRAPALAHTSTTNRLPNRKGFRASFALNPLLNATNGEDGIRTRGGGLPPSPV